MRSSRSAPLRGAIFVAAAVPLGLLIADAVNGSLGANPVETLVHTTGLWALRLLLLTLCMTPLQRALKQPWPVHIRRQLGLWSFFYASVHFSLFLIFDLELSLAALAGEVLERPYITAGFTALMLLLPLAVTSTSAWQRRLKRRWKALHRLIYLAAPIACLHFLWKTKVTEWEPWLYTTLFVALMLTRLPTLRARRVSPI